MIVLEKKWNIEYIDTKTGHLTVEVEGYLLHSKYNPLREIEKKLAEIDFYNHETILLFGIGLGYILKELQNIKADFQRIMIIDPLAEVLDRHVIEIEGFDILTEVNKTSIEAFINMRNKNYNKNIQVVCAPNYANLFLKEYKLILESVKNIQHMNQVLENTTRNFSVEWQRNYLQNISVLKDSYNFNDLIQYPYDVPVIVASGGPSLIKQLNLVKKYRNELILIASGSTVNTLLANDVIPDYVVSIDGGEANYAHFENIDQKGMKLIYGFSSHYKIQQNWFNEKYAILDAGDEEFKKYVKQLLNIDIPLIPGGASVANFAFSCAIKMTKGPVALIGQDLAYTNGYTHAASNKNAKKLDENLIIARRMYETKGYYGDRVLTDDAFMLMKNDFERLYKYYEELKPIYNCTEGGIDIEAIPKIPFAAFCEKYIEGKGTRVFSDNTSRKNSYDSILAKNKLRKELQFYEKVIKQLQFSLIILKRIKGNLFFDKKTLIELEKTDKMVVQLKESSAMHHILDPLILDIMSQFKPLKNETEEQEFNRVYQQNITLYKGLLEAIEYTKIYLNIILEEI